VATLRAAPDGLAARLPCAVETLALGPLSDEESRELARALVAEPAQADALAAGSRGNPLFLVEMAREHGRGVTFEAALAERLRALEPPARRLVELLAARGATVVQEVAAHAAALDRAAYTAAATALARAQLAVENG